MKLIVALSAAMLWSASAAYAEETPQLTFVSEFIHGLAVNEKNRDQAESELQTQRDIAEKNTRENGSTDPVEQNAPKSAAVIRNSTRIINELTSQIAVMQGMKLDQPFDQLPMTIAGLDEYKIKAHKQLIVMAKALETRPARGVDYKAMGDDVPKILALLQEFDHTLYQITPAVFATLVEGNMLSDDGNSGQNKRLIITKAERDGLVKSLDDSFGKKLNEENRSYLVASAVSLKNYLTQKDYKCSDEQ